MEISLSSLAIFLCSFPTQTKDQMCNLGLRYHCKPLHFLLRKKKKSDGAVINCCQTGFHNRGFLFVNQDSRISDSILSIHPFLKPVYASFKGTFCAQIHTVTTIIQGYSAPACNWPQFILREVQLIIFINYDDCPNLFLGLQVRDHFKKL